MRHAAAALMAAWVCVGCGTTMPLERPATAPVMEHPTEAIFTQPTDAVWATILVVLQERGEAAVLAARDAGNISTDWKEAPSLIHYRSRLGDEGTRVPYPARYRLLIHVESFGNGTRVGVTAEEETNFLILTGVDPETGRSYYRDSWQPTDSRTQREHELLEQLRAALRAPTSVG